MLELVIPRRRLPLFPLALTKVPETMLSGIPVQIIMSGWKLEWGEVGERPHWPNYSRSYLRLEGMVHYINCVVGACSPKRGGAFRLR